MADPQLLKLESVRQTLTQTAAANAQHTKNVSIATSAIIASIWTGLWGFDWAATHLSSDQLYQAILIAITIGTALTLLVVWLTFWAIGKAIDSNNEIQVTLKAQLQGPH